MRKREEQTSDGFEDVKPVNGPANFSFHLSNLIEVKLQNWPPSFIFNDHPEYKKDWDRAKREADSHLSKLLSLKIWSPYPILSYCLGAAETMDTKIHIRYFLFPLSSPTEQEHAVAQVIFETEIGASPGDIERIWVDALRENELSHDNVRHIRQAID